MKKLNNKKVAWIIREKQKGAKNKTIALIQKISAGRVREDKARKDMQEACLDLRVDRIGKESA
ncbi:MAG: hypothetical protein KKB25_01195 [Nanoarchaeota archaeon]|nr:hypothetical protein [Nanoarchaeota archaeon]